VPASDALLLLLLLPALSAAVLPTAGLTVLPLQLRPKLLLLLLLPLSSPVLALSHTAHKISTTFELVLHTSCTAMYAGPSDSASTEDDSASNPVLQQVSSSAKHCTNASVSAAVLARPSAVSITADDLKMLW
jgi:hypothetical protein